MEWSKDKTLKLIELLQLNASLWNPSLCETRRDKQKRKEELRNISDILGITVLDTTKKIQHLRTQYNRESAREARALAEDPNDKYISNWYAFDFLHFMKDSSKTYRILKQELLPKLKQTQKSRDEFSVFGEYVANELRSLKGEKNILVAKKKIQDIIFEVKMGTICDTRQETNTACTIYTNSSKPLNTTTIHNGKLFTPVMTTNHIEPLMSNAATTSGISEIIINGACHYSNFKVDPQ